MFRPHITLLILRAHALLIDLDHLNLLPVSQISSAAVADNDARPDEAMPRQDDEDERLYPECWRYSLEEIMS